MQYGTILNMDKLVLIDGNSLINRAFYAINPFSTKDGLPTNAVFGFMKLLFKIIEDEKPSHLAVAFDLPVPTFRHKMYSEYKATRNPMPNELAVQLPVLKDLLAKMNVCIAALEGYEADDIIGTLSSKFQTMEVVIFTGDRDSYQLVNEHVTVCFTKRGVSVTDRLTHENFFEKVGLTPSQIVDEKALMGDSSDNIPGVRGIGPKTAMDLLRTYSTAENVFANVDKLSPALQKKLDGQWEIAQLSHRLATIDTEVPLSITAEDCLLKYPFPQDAKSAFGALEFRSLLNSGFFLGSVTISAEPVICTTLSAADDALKNCDFFTFSPESDGLHLGINGTEYIFPFKENLLGVGFFEEDLIPLLKKLFTGEKRALVTDAKALAHKLASYNITLSCPVEDVSLLCYLTDSNQRAATAKGFAQDYNLPETNCACAIARAYEDTLQKIANEPEEKLYRELELPLTQVLFDMERTGVRVDESKFEQFTEIFNCETKELSHKIFELAGLDFNLNSPMQLSDVLFRKLGFDPKTATKNQRGYYSTSAEVLERLAEEHEIARLIITYREIQKLQSTYIDGIRPLIKDGIVHTTYNQTVTTTGRLSSANPNLQNIPVRSERGRELRKLFIAREGNLFVDADYSQIELRLLAHLSGCKQLQEAYRNDEDIHALTAAQVFGVPLSSVTSTMRRRAKAVNFGIIYGISAFGLAKDIGCSTSEAQRYIDRYFETYQDVKEYMDENVRRAKADGYVKTILGRKRYIAELKSPNYSVRSFGERAAMNMPLQGSAADIIKLAMLGVYKRLKAEGLQTKLVLQVHDELILDTPLGEKEAAERILKEEMENAVSLSVPLTAEVSSGVSWYDAK